MPSLSGLVLSVVLSASSTSSSIDLFRRIDASAGSPSVLYVAAHPDDENTRLLSWLIHAQGARAAYLSLTRGEGGQNLIGPEQAPLLGVIRTHELLAARAIDGAQQFFGRQADFGYSKSHEEALRIWNHETALADVVWVVRQFRPDVIITRFDPEGRETHGHHTASAILALEAFTAAADPKRFPEQLATVKPWQATSIVWNRGYFGQNAPKDTAGMLTVEVGGFDAMRGESYPEISARSRSMHKSQGFGATPQRGSVTEYFKPLAGVAPVKSLFDGVKRAALNWPKKKYSFENPAASVKDLLALPRSAALDALIVDAAAVYLDASIRDALVLEGGTDKLTITVSDRSAVEVTLRKAVVSFIDGSTQEIIKDKPLKRDDALVVEHTLQWPKRMTDATPAQQRVGDPTPPAPAEVIFTLAFGAREIEVRRAIQRTWNDPVVGERHSPIIVAPPVTVTPRDAFLLIGESENNTLSVRLRASKDARKGTLNVRAPAGVTVSPAQATFQLDRAGAEQVLTFEVNAKADGAISFTVDGTNEPAQALVTLDYPHIPLLHLTKLAEVKVARLELKRAGQQIGYIQGAGDEVASSLRQVGYNVSVISLDALEKDKLDGYDAIVIGVRAFNTHARLAALLPRLMKYVEAGGTLVTQYNTNSWVGALDIQVGPYPFTITHDRVTEEDAAITMLSPTHPVWNTPNRITQEDFAGWVQERGLYFANPWDARYTPLIAAHDQGEKDLQGGLLVTTHGNGRFVYTGLSFFRQLPAGVKGAYRLFANLLARNTK